MHRSKVLSFKSPSSYIPSPAKSLILQLTHNVRSNHTYRCPDDTQTSKDQGKGRKYWVYHRRLDPNGVKCDCEKVVEKHKGIADYARKKANRAIDAIAADLEVAEASYLKCFEVGV